MAFDKDDFLAALEELGETKVREKLALGLFNDQRKVSLGHEFLRRKAQEASEDAERRMDDSNREQINIARSAKNAAWAAAIAAIIAAISAVIAVLSG